MTCLKEMQSSEWRPNYYQLLFLGPLPHLLACLEQGIALTHAAKVTTKDLNEVSHEKLEELGRQRSEITSVKIYSASYDTMINVAVLFTYHSIDNNHREHIDIKHIDIQW
ncbi:hypothetical protein BDR05DRAFT_1062385, partial [Suillus weaverae]